MPASRSRSGRALRRSLAASVAAAVSASLLVVPSAAMAATVVARNLDSACPPGEVPSAGFHDTAGTTFEREIDCIVGYGVARGTGTHTFDPGASVTRGQMATFLANTLVASGRTRPANLPDAFGDDDASTHEANIDWLAAEGVAGGFTDGTYRPSALVTRAQMATFLNNLIREVTGSRLASSTDYFWDEDGNPHEPSINGLASRGIVTGTGDSRYSPNDAVTRQQMAGFLAREVDHLVDERHIDVPFGPDRLAVDPTTAVRLDTSDNTSASTADRGARTYTVAVPIGIERVDIALFPAATVTIASDGTPRFASNAPIAANAGTSIETVNGVTIDVAGGATDVVRVSNVAVKDHRVVFRIDATVIHAVVPVVWTDTIEPTQDRLDLESGATTSTPKPARETVAVGGAVAWGPAEPATGTNLGVGTVRDVNITAGWYTLDTGGSTAADHLLRFTGTDAYAYTASAEPKAGSPGPITHTQFQTWLSAGDRIDPGAYDPGKSAHVVTGDVPSAPSSIAAVVQQDGKVKITFTKPTNPVADDVASSYRLERAPVSGSTVGTFAEVRFQAANLVAEFLDTPTAAGTYVYRVFARSVTGNSPASAMAQVSVTAPPPATTASAVIDNGANNSGNANQVLDFGDQLQFIFDRAISIAGNWELVLVDADGTQVRLNNTVGSIAVSGTGANIVTVTVASNGPAVVAGKEGSAAGVQLGTDQFLQVLSAVGFSTGAGVWNLPRSGVEDATWNNSRVLVGRPDTPAAPQILSVTAATKLVEAGRNEVQAISASNATSGDWKLSLGTANGAPVTSALPWNVTAADLQTALEGLTGVGAGNVLVAGGPLTSGFTVTFRAGLSATDVAQLTVVESTLKVGDADATAPVGSTTVAGVSVNATIAAGDTVSVHALSGQLVGSAAAGPNGRTTVTLSSVTVGQQFYVVVQKPNGHHSRTAIVTAT